MSPFKFTLLIVGFLSPILTLAQSIKDVRINEIQVYNVNGFKDEYGHASGWIELHNTGYGKVNVAGCTLKIKGKAYQIPKGDPATVIPTRGYLVFFAGSTPNKGTFHTNFTLDDTNFIELYDIDGKKIDSFEFDPAEQKADVSFGWLEEDGGKESLKLLPATTPGGNNNTEIKISRAELAKNADPIGIVLTTINIFIVTIALTLLFFVFKYMGRFHVKAAIKKAERLNAEKNKEKKARAVTNDELAVIAIALYKHSKILHDKEELTLTINKVSKAYSPWSSKIYGLRQIPNKK